jgi:ABC-type sugar transport system ATPase subunit
VTVAARDVLEVRGVTKSFPGVRALQNVDLRLQSGRLLALLGENGAGKSTLISVLSGVIRPDAGQLLIDGAPVSLASPRDTRAHGIATIYQELSLCQNLTVAENIFLGNEPRTALGLLDRDRMNREAAVLLRRMALAVAPETPIGDLRVGQQQVVEIARALSMNARVIIMDEPTSALSQHEVDALLETVRSLKRDGVAIVYITHKLDELESIADDVVVMRDGAVVAAGPWGDYSQAQLVSLMVGRETSGDVRRREPCAAGAEVLRVNYACLFAAKRANRAVFKDISLRVCRGEVLGIFGLMGAGRTELLETIFGAHADRASLHLAIEGHSRSFRSPADAIAAGLALAPEDRKTAGLFLGMTSIDNVNSASLRSLSVGGVLGARRMRAVGSRLIEGVGFRGVAESPSGNLSGGNQQKVVLAKWLATNPKLLLLDEPTRGIDVNARREIYTLIERHVADGLAVIMASSDIPEILALCDRILVLREGEKSAEFTRDEATPESLLSAALPRDLPDQRRA